MYDLDDDGDEMIGAAFTTDRTMQESVMMERAKSILQRREKSGSVFIDKGMNGQCLWLKNNTTKSKKK